MTVEPWNTVYCGVMVYVNQSIYIRKISKKILGPKYLYGPFQAIEVEKVKNSQTSKSGMFNFAIQIWQESAKFCLKMAVGHIDIGFSFYLQ